MAKDAKYGQIDIPGIPDDEPVFVLRAQDVFAVRTVREYARHLDTTAHSEFYPHGAMTESPALDLAEKARMAANVMGAWPTKKLPD